MPQDTPALHVYERSVLDEDNDSLTLLARHIAAGAVVLDLGMGTGGLGKYLAARQSVTLDGVTLSEEEAQRAGSAYRQVVVADLDSADLTHLFAGQRYDRIVLADVLEHLKNPERILQQCHQLLQAGGQLLTSVPNVAYCGLLAELLQGEFRYRPEGLLDNTHLRFFTRQSLHRFFAQHGWQVKSSQTTTRDVLSSEFKGQFDLLPPAVSRHLLALPDASTYQFICSLEPAQAGDKVPPIDIESSAAALPLFSAQLYLAIDGQHDENLKVVCAGAMGGEIQNLRFDIPALKEGRYTQVRLDPADRPGFMRLASLRMHACHTALPVWTWESSAAAKVVLENAPQQQIAWSTPWGPSEMTWMQLHGDDPWVELPMTSAMLDSLTQHGGHLDMVATWPMSADYLQANQRLQTFEVNHTELQSQFQLQAQIQTTLGRRVHELSQEKSALMQRLSSVSSDLANTRTHLQNAQAHIARIENSKLFKWTRPLANLKYTVSRRLQGHSAPTVNTSPSASVTHPHTQAQANLPLPNFPVDVIVPVYRGLHDTQRCLLSALSSTCATAWHLVVINDCSPEPEVSQWLRELAAQEPRITLLENEENLGFVATVNRGMRLHPDRDVLLLNSDTEVANDWLDRIQRAAYSRPQVASVTPFSNNATICSYPRFCEGNELPAGWTTAQLDLLCAEHLAGQTVEVPTGIGFCMYIRRACLNQVGLFDVENFGKGYGEENDFCVRAEHAGWVNLHNLDTFVRHAGGVSFGDSKSERELLAMQTIRRLHPQYERDVQAFVQRDPARQARWTLDLARLTRDDRLTILNVIHNRAGGSLRHLDDLAKALSDRVQFLTLIPLNGGVNLRLHGQAESFALQWPSLGDAHWNHLVQTLRSLRVSHVHYHHLLGHQPKIALLHEALQTTHDFTAHDYYSFCPQISLTDENDRYCGEKGLDQCERCVQKRPAPDGLSIIEWRARSSVLLQSARHVIAPSPDTWKRMHRFTPQAHVVLAPHSDLVPARLVPNPKPNALSTERPMKVVLIGGLSKIKGADTLEAVASLVAKHALPIEFHLLGFGYRSLRTQPRAALTVHGAYDDRDLPALLKWLEPDLAWFPAQCPETYSYTLSACLEASLPVMASELGALPDRLHSRPWTWLIDWQASPQEWLEHLLLARHHLESALKPKESAPIQDENIEQFAYESQYLLSLKQPPRLNQPGEILQELQGFIMGSNSSPVQQSLPLKTLFWLRGLRLLAPLARMIPTHVQRRIKSILLG